jgi:hypothetical protein
LRGDLEPLRAFCAAAARLAGPRRPSGPSSARAKRVPYRPPPCPLVGVGVGGPGAEPMCALALGPEARPFVPGKREG